MFKKIRCVRSEALFAPEELNACTTPRAEWVFFSYLKNIGSPLALCATDMLRTIKLGRLNGVLGSIG